MMPVHRLVLPVLLGVLCLGCDTVSGTDDGPVVTMSATGAITFDVEGVFDLPKEEAYFTNERIYANMLIAMPSDEGERRREVRMSVNCPDGLPLGLDYYPWDNDQCAVEFMFATIAGGILFFRSNDLELDLAEVDGDRRTGRVISTVHEYEPGPGNNLVEDGYRVSVVMEFDLPRR